MATKKRNAPNNPSDDALLEELAGFTAAFDDTTMFQVEKVAGSNNMRVQRRIVLAILTRTADQLSDTSIKDPTTYTVMLEQAQSFAQYTKRLHELAGAASFRLRIADCRELAGKADAVIQP